MKAPEVSLCAQRTRMAWWRTGLSAGAVVLLAARPSLSKAIHPAELLIAGVALTGWVALIATAYRRGRGLDVRPPLPGSRTLLTYALVTVGFAVIGIVLILHRSLSPHGSVP
jgi:uncharacterized membrane protein YidH (DUF202 family)